MDNAMVIPGSAKHQIGFFGLFGIICDVDNECMEMDPDKGAKGWNTNPTISISEIRLNSRHNSKTDLRPLLQELRRRFEELYRERLARLVLFGSQARDDADRGQISMFWLFCVEKCNRVPRSRGPVGSSPIYRYASMK